MQTNRLVIGRRARIAIGVGVAVALMAVVPDAGPASAAPATGTFFALPPARILDTRTGNGAPVATMGPGSVLSFTVTGRGGVPLTGVASVVLNVTVVAPPQPAS